MVLKKKTLKFVLELASSMILVVGIFILIDSVKQLDLPFDANQLGLAIALLALGSMWWDKANIKA